MERGKLLPSKGPRLRPGIFFYLKKTEMRKMLKTEHQTETLPFM